MSDSFLAAISARQAEAPGASAAAEPEGSTWERKVAASAEEEVKGGGYHYWHDKVPQGEGAAPLPEHKPIEVATVSERALPEVTITDYGMMDDEEGGLVKLYIKLEGDLEGATADDVTFKVEASKFALNLQDLKCSMHLSIRGKTKLHTLHAERLLNPVRHEQCKFRISAKTNKLIVTLYKIENVYWDKLRYGTTLPYRRGGGGQPR